jgi:hypothetical protein
MRIEIVLFYLLYCPRRHFKIKISLALATYRLIENKPRRARIVECQYISQLLLINRAKFRGSTGPARTKVEIPVAFRTYTEIHLEIAQ